jgi:Immunity protein 35
MLDLQSAKDKVSKELAGLCPAGDRWLVLDDKIIERPFGWIFFYNSEKFLTTRNVIHRLAGNGPVFVNRETGAVAFFGSTPPLEVILAEYESKLADG